MTTLLPLVPVVDPAFVARRRTADKVFRGALAFNAALTAFWVFVTISGRDAVFFQDYRIDRATLMRVGSGIVFFYVLWGFLWYGIKSLLLRTAAGFSKAER